VLVWSYFYLYSESDFRRFLSIILLFLCSMFTLVCSADLLSMLVAWDLLGFTSLFLVIFFRSRSSISGGVLTGLRNRLGDVFFLALFGLLTYSTQSCLSWGVLVLLFIGMTKSAQVPFSGWLPAAILAPTPVSALVHSSTLVTAGVYLLYRFLPLACSFLIYVGIFTTLISGLAAIFECDIKKVIALSTLSQLGLIITSLGTGERSLCFAHLNIHASFKALLFMAMGTIIHTVYGSQELRSAGSHACLSPFAMLLVVVACISICGMVFLSGWSSKEAILESCLSSSISLFSVFLFYCGIGLTFVYRIVLVRSMCSTGYLSNACLLSYSNTEYLKAPLYWLFTLSVLQGTTFSSYVHWPLTFVSISDALVIWVFFLAALTSLFFPLPTIFNIDSPFVRLCYSTCSLARVSVLFSHVSRTEVSCLQAGGLALVPGLV